MQSAQQQVDNAESSSFNDSETDAETTPLISGKGFGELTSPCYTEDASKDLEAQGIVDTMLYSTQKLTSWEVFGISSLTVWYNSKLWFMMLRLAGIAVLVQLATVFLVPDPVILKVSRFTEISKFLNVVVGLLLGFFLSSSMNRWYTCVNGFLTLLDAIRNLQMQFTALGVPEPETILCLRYGLSSAWLLYGQLVTENKKGEAGRTASDQMWQAMSMKVARIDRSGNTMMLAQWEIDALKKTRDPPGIVWMWVAALIGRLAQDGWIPPMPSPTYGRVMNLCQEAHAGIREVRAAISVQSPFPYTHALATLVQINNLLNAVTFGVVSGLAISTSLAYHGVRLPGQASVVARGRDQHQDMQTMAVTFMYCSLGPLLYQALLLISVQLAQPFEHGEAWIPMDRLADQLEQDMCNGRDLTENMAFEKPAYKLPHPKEQSPRRVQSATVM